MFLKGKRLQFSRLKPSKDKLDWANASQFCIEDSLEAASGLSPIFCVQCAIALMQEQPENPFPLSVILERIVCGPSQDGLHAAFKIGWRPETLPRGHSVTYSRNALIEYSAIAVAFSLISKLTNCRVTEVAERGDRADYYLNGRALMLEVSGTDMKKEVRRRHRRKTKQLLKNPYGLGGYVVVSCISGQCAYFSFHPGATEWGVSFG
jgi:hypothetical protein